MELEPDGGGSGSGSKVHDEMPHSCAEGAAKRRKGISSRCTYCLNTHLKNIATKSRVYIRTLYVRAQSFGRKIHFFVAFLSQSTLQKPGARLTQLHRLENQMFDLICKELPLSYITVRCLLLEISVVFTRKGATGCLRSFSLNFASHSSSSTHSCCHDVGPTLKCGSLGVCSPCRRLSNEVGGFHMMSHSSLISKLHGNISWNGYENAIVGRYGGCFEEGIWWVCAPAKIARH
ncbi:hypothetical protein ZWY2020_049604 [Hordeum vulgare]|nr:hypothetical protein ZWY2020_049604 [Hordeum vulgare]